MRPSQLEPLPLVILLALAACDSNEPPETVAGRWVAIVGYDYDYTDVYSDEYAWHQRGTATDTLMLTVVDDAGSVSGVLQVNGTHKAESWSSGAQAANNDTTLSERSSMDHRDVEGLYAPPFLTLGSDGTYDAFDLRVSGDRAEGTVEGIGEAVVEVGFKRQD